MAQHAHDHEHGDGHDHAHEEEDRRIRVLHGASPFCHWSFGYEPVLERLRLLYGAQIKVNAYWVPVYDSWKQHLENYELDDAGMRAWVDEMDALIGLPANRAFIDDPAESCVPGTLVVHAAEAVKPGAGERVARAILTALYLEGTNFDDHDKVLKLAEQAGAPRKQVEAALQDGRAEAALGQEAQDYHSLGLNFYALQARDFEGRTVTIDHAFDAAKMEEAVEWLARGKLRKHALPPVDQYVARRAPVTLFEVQRVFRLDAAQALKAAQPAEKAGKVTRRDLGGHAVWVPR